MITFSRAIPLAALGLALAAVGTACVASTEPPEYPATATSGEALKASECPPGSIACVTWPQGCAPADACLVPNPDPGCTTCTKPAPSPTSTTPGVWAPPSPPRQI